MNAQPRSLRFDVARMNARPRPLTFNIAGAWIEPAPRANPDGFLDAAWIVRTGRVVVRPYAHRLDDWRVGRAGREATIVARGYTRDHAEELIRRRAQRDGLERIGCSLYRDPAAPAFRLDEGYPRECEFPAEDPDIAAALEAVRKVRSVDLGTLLADLREQAMRLRVLELKEQRTLQRAVKLLVDANRDSIDDKVAEAAVAIRKAARGES